MWDLPEPGIEPVSPALAGRFLSIGPPGKSSFKIYNLLFILILVVLHLPALCGLFLVMQELLFVVVLRFLIAVTFLVVENRL